MTSEIRLVQEIEPHECLYNCNLPEYSRKDLADEAWSQVSKNTNMTMTECKEKWRNIRSSFLRSLKPSNKIKKPYYLAPYLNFILPFMKPLHFAVELAEEKDNNAVTVDNIDGGMIISSIKSETESDLEESNITDLSEPNYSQDPLHQSDNTIKTNKKRKNLDKTGTNKTFNKFFKNLEESNNMITSPNSSKESMQYFLMSILSEFDEMTPEQIRLFKIRVMLLINDIKTNFDEVKQTLTSTNENARLQKKLINLLIKSMQKQS